jgi:hypothetical protein
MTELIQLMETQAGVNRRLESLLKQAVEQAQEADSRFADLKAYFPQANSWGDIYRALDALMGLVEWIEKNQTYAEYLMGQVHPRDQADGGHTYERDVMGQDFSPMQWAASCMAWEQKEGIQ